MMQEPDNIFCVFYPNENTDKYGQIEKAAAAFQEENHNRHEAGGQERSQ
jgi:hypothetical protein